MDGNRLRMNSAKTDFILIGSRQQLVKCKTTSILVSDEIIQRSPIIKYLGALIDERLSFKQFINSKCRMAMWNLQKLKAKRNVLTDDVCKTLVSALVLSHLDYANVILSGLPEVDIKKMQHVQNMAAKLVHKCSTMESSTCCLRNLHWLPMSARIEHKLLTITYKCLNGDAPEYLSDLLSVIPESRRMLRSSNKYKQLVIPKVKRKTFTPRSFSTMTPSFWNELPDSLHRANSVETFEAELKEYLSDLLSVIPESRRMLRSSNKYKQLVIPKVKRKTFTPRSFSTMTPSFWNELPDSLHRANSVETFEAELKTLLFRRYYM